MYSAASGFYAILAFAGTASVQRVGVYLVFTSLILPALAVRSLRAPLRLPLAYAAGALGYRLGPVLSARLDPALGRGCRDCDGRDRAGGCRRRGARRRRRQRAPSPLKQVVISSSMICSSLYWSPALSTPSTGSQARAKSV